MIGDQKQLGPVFKGQIDGPDSMFTRLILGGIPYTMLTWQYRMQGQILKMPNYLYYGNQIVNKYRAPSHLPEILKRTPILFIDHQQFEQKQDTSYMNIAESEMVADIARYLVKKHAIPTSSIGIISPYSTQLNQLKSILHDMSLDQQVLTIDSMQGREKDVVIFSAVRSNTMGEIGFVSI